MPLPVLLTRPGPVISPRNAVSLLLWTVNRAPSSATVPSPAKSFASWFFPPRARVAPASTVTEVLLANASTTCVRSVPSAISVAPVYWFSSARISVPCPCLVKSIPFHPVRDADWSSRTVSRVKVSEASAIVKTPLPKTEPANQVRPKPTT
jgi:hypothetical protein